MSKHFLFALTGISLAISSTGCCCLGHLGYNRNPCGCPPAGYTTGMYQSADPSQLSYVSSTTQTASTGYTTTAAVPTVTTTAAMPGAVYGAPIYNAAPGTYTQTAAIPVQSLPPY